MSRKLVQSSTCTLTALGRATTPTATPRLSGSTLLLSGRAEPLIYGRCATPAFCRASIGRAPDYGVSAPQERTRGYWNRRKFYNGLQMRELLPVQNAPFQVSKLAKAPLGQLD